MLLHDGFGPGPGLGLSRCSLLLSLTDMGSRRGKATLKLSQRYVWSLVVGCLETPPSHGRSAMWSGTDVEVGDSDVTFGRW